MVPPLAANIDLTAIAKLGCQVRIQYGIVLERRRRMSCVRLIWIDVGMEWGWKGAEKLNWHCFSSEIRFVLGSATEAS